ncbi:uncharacterized protein LOC108672938, partial [Hyalella azteca]|uniref:Uncharacterized protein LOC108672938 n=1 Tax=Hyalella azteca TaxID=294128 RepID=A0A8B7NR58_HYAAZ
MTITTCMDVDYELVRYVEGAPYGDEVQLSSFVPQNFDFMNFMTSSDNTGYTYSFDESCLCKDRATYTLTINDETIDVNYGETGHIAKTFTACIPVVTFTLRRYVEGVEFGETEIITDFAPQNFNFRDFEESSGNTGYNYYFDDDGLCTSLTNYELSINTDTFDVTRAQNGFRSHTFTQCEENVQFTLRRYVNGRLIGDPFEFTDFAPRSFSFGGSLQLSPDGTTGLTYQFTENGLCTSHATYRITIDGTTVDATAGSPIPYSISNMNCRYFDAEVIRYVDGVEDDNHVSSSIFLPRDEQFLNAAVTLTENAVNVLFDEQGICSASFIYDLKLVLNDNTQFFTVTPGNTFTRSATLCDTVEVHIVRKLDSQDFGDKYDYTGGRIPGEHDFDFSSFRVDQREISQWTFAWNSYSKCPVYDLHLETNEGDSESCTNSAESCTMNCLKLYKAQTVSIHFTSVDEVTISGAASIPIKRSRQLQGGDPIRRQITLGWDHTRKQTTLARGARPVGST